MKSTAKKAGVKGSPIPVRFEESEGDLLRALAEKTGIPAVELVRRAVRYAVPKFKSGEVNLLEFGHPAKP